MRQNQSRILREARGRRIVEVSARHPEDEKYVVDKQYFDDLLRNLKATTETLAVMSDERLFRQILRAAETVGEDLRRGRLHSFRAAFGDD